MPRMFALVKANERVGPLILIRDSTSPSKTGVPMIDNVPAVSFLLARSSQMSASNEERKGRKRYSRVLQQGKYIDPRYRSGRVGDCDTIRKITIIKSQDAYGGNDFSGAVVSDQDYTRNVV